MRKLLVSILALVYLTASTGTSVDIHYCMGKLVDWTFSHKESKQCDNCGMEKKGSPNGCCKDEQKFVKSDLDQKSTGNALEFLQFAAVAPEHGNPHAEALPRSIDHSFPRANAPPLSSSCSIYLLHCNFRI